MIIRKLEEEDLEAVNAICMDSFLQSVAGSLSDEGITTFSNIAACDAFLGRMKGDNLILVAESDEKIEGVIELKEGRHIAMLFILPERQKNGIGRKLLLSALSYAKTETVTVSASLSSVTAYEKYGFERSGEVDESAGLVYQPMEIKLNERQACVLQP
ncbi:acetyltransferase [Marinomonas ushuaiensis DSM 15871]|uniref:Acetyltransferase n=1 Tax=Marinomonas ushuaiensis DSM 15871 TaxID=1122207 RepID=X7E998_9GAMM|nr:GNAT family N-acetyltransferase [Marinomonas ushuaiensis]ETX11728.1 acetyltransferase [Marinomonas ushuaiensis DSM 15871]